MPLLIIWLFKKMFDKGSGKFTFSGGSIEEGETEHYRYTVSETYMGDSVKIPVSIINGKHDGSAVFLTAAVHGDELNGIEVVREVARNWNHNELNGTIVCLPVVNVPGFINQERYLPIQDRDLNRAFPGSSDSTSAKRIANTVFENFLSKCDFGIDFHTSTRGRTNMFHVRADMNNQHIERLARSFGSNVIVSTEGSEGTIRRECSDRGIPTVTIEMGKAHRFERDLINKSLQGVQSVFSEFGLYLTQSVSRPRWSTVIEGWGEKTWIRANDGGIVDMKVSKGDFLPQGGTLCEITGPFKDDRKKIEAPFDGLVLGVLRNPVVYSGNPICHFVQLDDPAERIVKEEQGYIVR